MKLIKSVVIVSIILVISLVAYSLLSNKDIGSNSKKRKNEFINYYSEEVRRLIFQKINNEESPFCSGNCKEIYQISNNDIDFEVLDSDENIEVVYKALETGKYKSINVDDNDCSVILDTTCDGTVLKNYISKKWIDKR